MPSRIFLVREPSDCEPINDLCEKLDNVVIYNKGSKAGIVTFNVKGIFAQDAASYFNSKNIDPKKRYMIFQKVPGTKKVKELTKPSYDVIDTSPVFSSIVPLLNVFVTFFNSNILGLLFYLFLNILIRVY